MGPVTPRSCPAAGCSADTRRALLGLPVAQGPVSRGAPSLQLAPGCRGGCAAHLRSGKLVLTPPGAGAAALHARGHARLQSFAVTHKVTLDLLELLF